MQPNPNNKGDGPAMADWSAGPTAAMYDDGESTWPAKLHLGCGGVYLRGYINIDALGRTARYHPELAEANATDIWNYYARLSGTATDLPKRRETCADLVGDLERDYAAWQIQRESVAKVVCIQMLEHLSPVKAAHLLTLLHSMMRPGAPLIVSVPDMEGTINMLEHGTGYQHAFGIRHLRGSRRDSFNVHKAWYTRDTLDELLEASGYMVRDIPNFHLYPAIVIRAEKI